MIHQRKPSPRHEWVHSTELISTNTSELSESRKSSSLESQLTSLYRVLFVICMIEITTSRSYQMPVRQHRLSTMMQPWSRSGSSEMYRQQRKLSAINPSFMKFTFLLIPLVLLSACTPSDNPQESQRIHALEIQIASLSGEIATLREDMNLLKLWGVPGVATPTGNGIYPEWTSFAEGSYDGCMKQAGEDFINAGNAKCRESGFSETDIAWGKCTINKKVIADLTTMRSGAEWNCKSLYNP